MQLMYLECYQAVLPSEASAFPIAGETCMVGKPACLIHSCTRRMFLHQPASTKVSTATEQLVHSASGCSPAGIGRRG